MATKQLTIAIFAFFLAVSVPATAATYTSSQNGSWGTATTWGGAGTPGDGDVVSISHKITVSADRTIGAGSGEAIGIGNSGTLTVGAGKVMVCKGNINASGNVTLEAGAILEMAGNGNTVIKILPGSTKALLRMQGTSTSRCQLRGVSTVARTRITAEWQINASGRVVATYSDFKNLGGADQDGYNYMLGTLQDSVYFGNCTFDNCAVIDPLNATADGIGFIEFNKCKWINSPGTPIKSRGKLGRVYRIINCDFDKSASLRYATDLVVEDCLFRSGVGIWDGVWKSFARNFIRATGQVLMQHGRDITDCIYIYDDPDNNNPHVASIQQGSGNTNITGCVFWWPGHDVWGVEGDGFMVDGTSSGTRAENTVTFDRNIFLPNADGPEAENNMSFTGFTILNTHDTRQIVFKRNTIFTGSGMGGLNVGESNPTTAGDIAYVKSNLFVGGSTGQGRKMADLGFSRVDVFKAEDVDYNAGYRIRNGYAFNTGNGSGKGYDHSNRSGIGFTFTGSDVIGPNDIDDVDPQFVDWTRTPVSWTGSMQATMDRLTPGSGFMVQDLLDYIREGFRPQNAVLANAGDPADGSPDMGAVSLSGTIFRKPRFTSATLDSVQIGGDLSYAIEYDLGSVTGAATLTPLKKPAWVLLTPTSLTGTATGSPGVDTCALSLKVDGTVYDTLLLVIVRHNAPASTHNGFAEAVPIPNSMSTLSTPRGASVQIGLAQADGVGIRVYNLQGQVVWQMARRQMSEGYHNISMGSKLQPGVYFVSVHRTSGKQSQRMLLK